MKKRPGLAHLKMFWMDSVHLSVSLVRLSVNVIKILL